jgi:hypothetical protein
MALNQSALNELLDALRAGGDLDVIREGLALVLQALIDTEATQQIGARPMSAPTLAPPTATAPGPGYCRPQPVMSSWASRNYGKARSSQPCWSRVAASTGRCWQS